MSSNVLKILIVNFEEWSFSRGINIPKIIVKTKNVEKMKKVIMDDRPITFRKLKVKLAVLFDVNGTNTPLVLIPKSNNY